MQPKSMMIVLLAVALFNFGADAAQPAPSARPAATNLQMKCLTKAQIATKLRAGGYQLTRQRVRETRTTYVFHAYKGRSRLRRLYAVTVNRCTGKVLSVAVVRQILKAKMCLSKTKIKQKLEAAGYYHVFTSFISGPHNSPDGKIYYASGIYKPDMCSYDLTVNCYTGAVIKRTQSTCY